MMRRALPPLFGVVAAAGLLAFSFLQDPEARAPFVVAPVRLSGMSPFATCTASTISAATYGDNYLNAEVEPRVAVSPRTVGTDHLNIVGVWQQDRWATGGARGIVAAYSSDGGRTWGIAPLPFSLCVRGGVRLEAASDPWVSIGPDGTAYAAGLVFSPVSGVIEQGVAAATSTDGGRTWGRPRVVARDDAVGLSDKDSITADPVRPGVAYLVWDRTGQAGVAHSQPMWFSRTTNYGATWSTPRLIPQAKGQTIGHEIVVDPRTDVLYDFFARPSTFTRIYCQPETQDCANTASANEVAIMRSTDGGATWSAAHVLGRFVSVGPGATASARVRSGTRLPDAAIDPRNGALYVVWEDARFMHRRRDEIAIVESRDGGRDWTAPRKVPSPPGAALTPSIAVTADGTVAVTYYSLAVERGSDDLITRYWLTMAPPGGLRFGRPVPLSPVFNMLSAPYSEGFFLGDYEGLAAAGSRFVSVYSVANDGDLSNRTDLYTAVVE